MNGHVRMNAARGLRLPSGVWVFPTHAPGPRTSFVDPPEVLCSYADMKQAVCALHKDVRTVKVVSLQMTPTEGVDHWFPMQGGKRTHIVPEEVDRVCAFIEGVPAGTAVLLHCYHGLNRTLLVLAALYLRAHRATIQDALHRVRQVRPPGIIRAETVDALVRWWNNAK